MSRNNISMDASFYPILPSKDFFSSIGWLPTSSYYKKGECNYYFDFFDTNHIPFLYI